MRPHPYSIPDGLEDKNFNGRLDAGETDAMRNDTDQDGLLDGTEDANRDGTRQSNETSPILVDSDNDGIGDYQEVNGAWCYNGEVGCSGSSNGARVTNATVDDTDGDGLIDGLEIGVECQSYADYAARRCDRGPSTHTDPLDTDTDDDGLPDGVEDRDHDGSTPLRGNETRPDVADTDKDGLCDGNCSGYGEDLNLNGYRDQDSDGNWTETDPLANDSDVDGIWDGREVLGSWCNATETSQQCSGAPNSARILDPLNPDTDGDGLRDGQEIAGWKVLVWREMTMEVMATYNVTSDPLHANNDGDNNNDFVEFQNGSDPWKADTDGDGFTDSGESAQGMNVTGFYMQPPQFIPISIPFQYIPGVPTQELIVSKDCRGGALGLVGCTPRAQVAFQVWSHWGISYWEVNYGRPQLNDTEEAEVVNITGMSSANASLICTFNSATSAIISKDDCDRVAEIWGRSRVGPASISGSGGGQNVVNVTVEFTMTTAEDHWDGPWIQARAFDIYGAGAQKTVKLKSSMEKIVDFLAAVANAIAAAISALIKFLLDAAKWLVDGITDAIAKAFEPFARPLAHDLESMAKGGFGGQNGDDNATVVIHVLLESQVVGDAMGLFLMFATILVGIDILLAPFIPTPIFFVVLLAVQLVASFVAAKLLEGAQKDTQEAVTTAGWFMTASTGLMNAFYALVGAIDYANQGKVYKRFAGPMRDAKQRAVPLALVSILMTGVKLALGLLPDVPAEVKWILSGVSFLFAGLGIYFYFQDKGWLGLDAFAEMNKVRLITCVSAFAMATLGLLKNLGA